MRKLAVVLAVLGLAAYCHAAKYEAFDLGTLGGASSYAQAINDAGQVVGYAQTASGSYRAFLWTLNGGMVDLGTWGQESAYARGINDAGQVVGEASARACLWTPRAGLTNLGTLGGQGSSCAYAINDAGQVVGESFTASYYFDAFLWTPDAGMIDLGTLGGAESYAYDINEAGQVAGWADTAGWYHPCLWVPVNGPPVAVALVNGQESVTVDEQTPSGTTVTLDGSQSYDPDEDALTYEWDFTSDGTVDSTEATVQAVYSVGGPYTATLTVTDPSGEVSTDTVSITVVLGSPANQLDNAGELIDDAVASGKIAPELEQSLLAKVDAAIAALARGNANDAKVAMNDLKALVNQVEAQTGKKIDPAVAAEVIRRANRIIAALGGQ